MKEGIRLEKNIISLKALSKRFDEKLVIDGIDLDIREKEFMTILGPSGCGKTTTLRIMAGFETMDEGELYFDGKEISQIPSYKRQINTVFQKYALFPHLNVYENIAFGLKIKKLGNQEIEGKVTRMLKLVDLEGFEKRKVNSLSGGQQQRIAIARALVCEPKVLLLDEPLGALDLKLRQEMQIELKDMQKKLGITFIYVTHDQEEALTMSDRIVVMSKGKIQQIGSPEDIYNEPENKFIARFIGESNILEGVMVSDYKVKLENKEFECVDFGFDINENVDVCIRPEDVQIVESEHANIRGRVDSILFKGVHYEIMVEDQEKMMWKIHTIHHWDIDKQIGLKIDPEAIHVMRKED